MALAMSSGSAAMLLAYCVTGLSLLTIDNGMAGRGASTKIVTAAAHARRPVFDGYVKPAVSGPSGKQLQTRQLEAPANETPGKREELRELRRRAVRAFMVITLLKNSKTNQLE